MLRSLLGTACLAFGILAGSIGANATPSLVGDSIDVKVTQSANPYDEGAPNTYWDIDSGITVISPGAEFSAGNGTNIGDSFPFYSGESVNVEASSIIFTYTGSFLTTTFWTFSDLDFDVANAVISAVTTDSPYFSIITFGDHSVVLSHQNIPGAGTFTVTLETTIQDPSPVPEPSTLALFGLGLAGLGAARRRRRLA